MVKTTLYRGYVIVAKQLFFSDQETEVSVPGLFLFYAKHTFLFIYLYICFVFPTQKTMAQSRNPDNRWFKYANIANYLPKQEHNGNANSFNL